MGRSRKNLCLTLTFVFLFSLTIRIASAYEVEYEKAKPETPLSDWWENVTGIPGGGVGYQEYWQIPSEEECVPEGSPLVIFTVTPAFPKLYWKHASADYYDHFGWGLTTESELVEEFPPRAESVVYTFTVEFNGRSGMNPLHVPESKTNLSDFEFSPPAEVGFYLDELADIYAVEISGPDQLTVTYRATYHPPPTVKELRTTTWTSVVAVPGKLRELYLQLPEDLPYEVRAIAESLRDPSLGVFDQILSVVRYLRTGFTYGPMEERVDRDVVLTYLQTKQGHCMHANSALVVLLRCLGIPARVSFGFYPMGEVDSKLLYMPPGHCQAEAYLPPFGWIYFNATPEKPPGAGGPEPLPTDYDAHTTEGWPGQTEPTDRRKPTVLDLEISPEDSKREEPIQFSVRLTSDGVPLEGKKVKVVNSSTGGVLTELVTTSGWSTQTSTFNRRTPPGEYFFTARFEGDETYAPSSSDTKPFLLYAPTTLNLKLGSTQVEIGSELEISGSLLDDFGAGAPLQEISVLIDGQPRGTVLTDAGGKYRGSISVGKDLNLGTHGVQTVFEPKQKGYLPSQSLNHAFEVLEQTQEEVPENTQVSGEVPEEGQAEAEAREKGISIPLWIVAAAGAAIAVPFIALAFFRRRKVEAEGRPPFPTSKSMKKMLADFGSAKKYREGLIAAYYQFVGMLMGANLYQVQPSQTARELTSELSAKLKDFPSDRFNSFVGVYEKAMFSEKPITEADFNRAVEDFCFTVDHMKWGGG